MTYKPHVELVLLGMALLFGDVVVILFLRCVLLFAGSAEGR